MNGRTNYLIVGIFVTAGIILLIALSLILAGGQSREANERYTLLFQRDISGLTVGAPVRYLGVEVGQVIDMRLMSDKGITVRVDLDILESTPINSASYGSLSFQGVTGVAFISLAADDSIEGLPLTVQDKFEYPLIPTRDIGLAALLSSGPEITNKLALLLDRANSILDGKNRVAITSSLANIEKLSKALASDEDSLAELPEQLHDVLDQFEKTVNKLQSTLDKTEPDFVAAMQSFKNFGKNLENLSVRLDTWLAEHEDDMDDFMDGGLGQTPALITDTRDTIRELEKLLEELRNNPSQVIYHPQNDPVVVRP